MPRRSEYRVIEIALADASRLVDWKQAGVVGAGYGLKGSTTLGSPPHAIGTLTRPSSMWALAIRLCPPILLLSMDVKCGLSMTSG